MKKFIFMALFGSTLFGDTSLGIIINSSNNNTPFPPNDHRYQQQYRDFDYNRDGYYDDFGLYFGFFNATGYFLNNIFFEYRDGYSYYDRLHRRGYFAPKVRHPRYYDYYDRRGNYIHKDEYRRPYRDDRRDYHHPSPHHYKDNGRVIEHRNDNRDYYKNDHKDVHRDDRRDHRDNAKVIYERHPDKERR